MFREKINFFPAKNPLGTINGEIVNNMSKLMDKMSKLMNNRWVRCRVGNESMETGWLTIGVWR